MTLMMRENMRMVKKKVRWTDFSYEHNRVQHEQQTMVGPIHRGKLVLAGKRQRNLIAAISTVRHVAYCICMQKAQNHNVMNCS